jgi:peptide deformylase
MNLVYYPDPFLETVVDEVDPQNPGFEPKELRDEMVDFMLSNRGIGLAANQIGLNKKVFVFGDSKDNASIFINPTILQYTEKTTVDNEGCLSFPDMYVKVKRPSEILASYLDDNLEEQITKIEGYSAKVYLHELDHLLGITIKDRVSKLKWDRAEARIKKARRFHTSRLW